METAEGQTCPAKLWVQQPQGGLQWPPPGVANWPKLKKMKRRRPEQAQTAEPRHLEGVPVKRKKMNTPLKKSNLAPTPPAEGQTAKVHSTRMKMEQRSKTVSMSPAAVSAATVTMASKLWKMHRG